LETAGLDSIGRTVFDRLNARPQRRRASALRMAPMIDMIFLLLIFFLVTANWQPNEDFLPLELAGARARGAAAGKVETLEIYIDGAPKGCLVRIGQAHTVRIGDKAIDADLAVLMERMDECLRAQKRFAADPIEIVCSPEVKWDHLARIYNLFFGAGLTDITFRMTQ